jgi:hypothetical protein
VNCCSLSQGCNIRAFWRRAEVYLKDFFRMRTLADLLNAMSDTNESDALSATFHSSAELRPISVGSEQL